MIKPIETQELRVQPKEMYPKQFKQAKGLWNNLHRINLKSTHNIDSTLATHILKHKN